MRVMNIELEENLEREGWQLQDTWENCKLMRKDKVIKTSFGSAANVPQFLLLIDEKKVDLKDYMGFYFNWKIYEYLTATGEISEIGIKMWEEELIRKGITTEAVYNTKDEEERIILLHALEDLDYFLADENKAFFFEKAYKMFFEEEIKKLNVQDALSMVFGPDKDMIISHILVFPDFIISKASWELKEMKDLKMDTQKEIKIGEFKVVIDKPILFLEKTYSRMFCLEGGKYIFQLLKPAFLVVATEKETTVKIYKKGIEPNNIILNKDERIFISQKVLF